MSILTIARGKSSRVFTGLIDEVGRVVSFRRGDRSTQLRLAAPKVAAATAIGHSVAVNGCCLTVSAKEGDRLSFDLLGETLGRTNLKQLRPDNRVNLERALAAGAPLGGHFIQGHVDYCAEVISFEPSGDDHRLEIDLPDNFAHYAADQGSIAINGISLTIAEVLPKSLVVWIIPYTQRHTNVGDVGRGNLVNVEFDILAKYVERMLARSAPQE